MIDMRMPISINVIRNVKKSDQLSKILTRKLQLKNVLVKSKNYLRYNWSSTHNQNWDSRNHLFTKSH